MNEKTTAEEIIEAAANRNATLDRMMQPKTREEQREAIVRKINALDCSAAREAGTYDAARIDALRTKLAEIEAEEKAEFAAEWTEETTVARRAEWNAMIKANAAENGGKVSMREVAEWSYIQGWGAEELKKAVAIYNL